MNKRFFEESPDTTEKLENRIMMEYEREIERALECLRINSGKFFIIKNFLSKNHKNFWQYNFEYGYGYNLNKVIERKINWKNRAKIY